MADSVVFKGEYFEVTKEDVVGRKTPIYYVWSSYGMEIAQIKWYGAWRKFCLFPDNETVWDNKCLAGIIECIDKINTEYSNNK